MTTDQATTVQPATYDDLIVNECKLVAYYLKHGQHEQAGWAMDRLRYWTECKASDLNTDECRPWFRTNDGGRYFTDKSS